MFLTKFISRDECPFVNEDSHRLALSVNILVKKEIRKNGN